MVEADGSTCTGCINKKMFNLGCKLDIRTTIIDGCRKCGDLAPSKYIYFDTKCDKYGKDPMWWQKDPYG